MDEEVIKDIGKSVSDMVFIRVSATDLSEFNSRLESSSASIKSSSDSIKEIIKDIQAERDKARYDTNILSTDTIFLSNKGYVRETKSLDLLGLIGNLAGFFTFLGITLSDKVRAVIVPVIKNIMTELGIGEDFLNKLNPIIKLATGLLTAFFAYRSIKKIVDIFMVVGKLAELIAVAGSLVGLERDKIRVEKKKLKNVNSEVRKRREEIVKNKKDLKSKNWLTRTWARIKIALPVIKKLGISLGKILAAATGFGLVAITVFEIYDLVKEIITEYKAYNAPVDDSAENDSEFKLPVLDQEEKSKISGLLGREVIFDRLGKAISLKEEPEPPKPKPIETPMTFIDRGVEMVSSAISEASEIVVEAKKKPISVTSLNINNLNNSTVFTKRSAASVGSTAPYSTSVGR